MFLNELTSVEKNAFMGLSIYAAKANGILADEEKLILDAYCREMDIESFDIELVQPLNEITNIIAQADLRTKKIITLEILGLVYADGEYDENEKTFVSEYAEKIGLSKNDVLRLTEVIKKYLDVLKEVANSIE